LVGDNKILIIVATARESFLRKLKNIRKISGQAPTLCRKNYRKASNRKNSSKASDRKNVCKTSLWAENCPNFLADRETTARPPFGQKIVPIFWPTGKTTARESFFRESFFRERGFRESFFRERGFRESFSRESFFRESFFRERVLGIVFSGKFFRERGFREKQSRCSKSKKNFN
jgi:hypothetical protein